MYGHRHLQDGTQHFGIDPTTSEDDRTRNSDTYLLTPLKYPGSPNKAASVRKPSKEEPQEATEGSTK